MRVVFVRQFVHLTTYFFIAANVNHVLAELLVTDEPVVRPVGEWKTFRVSSLSSAAEQRRFAMLFV